MEKSKQENPIPMTIDEIDIMKQSIAEALEWDYKHDHREEPFDDE